MFPWKIIVSILLQRERYLRYLAHTFSTKMNKRKSQQIINYTHNHSTSIRFQVEFQVSHRVSKCICRLMINTKLFYFMIYLPKNGNLPLVHHHSTSHTEYCKRKIFKHTYNIHKFQLNSWESKANIEIATIFHWIKKFEKKLSRKTSTIGNMECKKCTYALVTLGFFFSFWFCLLTTTFCSDLNTNYCKLILRHCHRWLC